MKTLENDTVKSVSFELNVHLEEHRSLIGELTDLGFELREEVLETSLPKDGVWEGIGNHIFYR